jgi:hypothetical protein
MRQALVALVLLLGAGCTMTDPRPVYHPATSTEDGRKMLVVGVDRDLVNRATVDGLARELAFALAQRGRSAVDVRTFLDATDAAGRPMPSPLRTRLQQGIADGDLVAWLTAESVRTLIFLEVQIFDQVWSQGGKRTRVGLAARGRDLSNGEAVWRAFTTPEVEDEPGRGFQLATEAALAALARVINGDPEPTSVPRLVLPIFNKMKW